MLPALPSASTPAASRPVDAGLGRHFETVRQRLLARVAELRIPAFTVPAPLARLAARLPQRPPTLALTLALNLALGRILAREDLAPLTGRHLRLRVADAGLTLDFTLAPAGFRPLAPGGRPDLTLAATSRDFLALALREEDADTLFFSRRLLMEGDTDLGLLVKNTLDAVDWDGLCRTWAPAALLRRLGTRR